MSGVAKTKQLMAKLTSTATTERKLLTPGHRFVKRTITAAANNGSSKIYQGSALIIFYCPRITRNANESEGDIVIVLFLLRLCDALVFQSRMMAEVHEQTELE